MDLTSLRQHIIEHITHYLKKHLPASQIDSSIYHYAVIPPGKLFRPLLAHAVYEDLLQRHTASPFPPPAPSPLCYYAPISLLACSIEIHHTYTLIHDDLPCLDNDDFRRNRPSTHRAFAEGQALIAGDGLLNLSYHLLGFISSTPHLSELLRFYSICTGPKGVVGGQLLEDQLFSQKRILEFDEILLIHKLKTARLIQLATTAPLYLLGTKDISGKLFKDLFRLGHHIGLLFQLLDDKDDFRQGQTQGRVGPSEHESRVSAFFIVPDKAEEQLQTSYNAIQTLFKRHHLIQASQVFEDYYKASH